MDLTKPFKYAAALAVIASGAHANTVPSSTAPSTSATPSTVCLCSRWVQGVGVASIDGTNTQSNAIYLMDKDLFKSSTPNRDPATTARYHAADDGKCICVQGLPLPSGKLTSSGESIQINATVASSTALVNQMRQGRG